MKHVMLKTYDNYKKILPLPSTFVYKKYGTINVTTELKYNTWYTLDNKENIAEANNSYTSARHELTNQKYSLKKDMKTCKLFMILEITPSILLPFYRRKNNKNIHSLSEPALAYLMLYAGKSNLVFDNAKGILIYSCLYFTNNVTTDDNRFSEILRCYNKEFQITENNGLFCINNDNKSFDTVFMIGQNNYVGLIEEKKHLVANILIIYFNNKEEASEVFEYLLKHNEFVDVSFVDFFARKWKIDTTVRPEMRNDIENGYVVRATKVDR